MRNPSEDVVVKFPLQACVFFSPLGNVSDDHGQTITHAGSEAVEKWCEEMIPGRYYQLIGGDHEYVYDDVEDKLGPFDTWVDYYVFHDRDAMMLFKLRWGGDA